MTSPRPPVLEKGAHSAPTNTMLSRSSAWTESAWRPRAAGARGAAARAARLMEGRTARRPTAVAVDPAASALADMVIEPAEVLHVAQSRFHGIAPGRAFGLDTVWVDRRAGRPGRGVTMPSEAEPDLRVESLGELVALIDQARAAG